eukprot:8898490-Pyramimonas_sp.AAC.1
MRRASLRRAIHKRTIKRSWVTIEHLLGPRARARARGSPSRMEKKNKKSNLTPGRCSSSAIPR